MSIYEALDTVFTVVIIGAVLACGIAALSVKDNDTP